MTKQFVNPKGSAEGTGLPTTLKKASKKLGYEIKTSLTASERLYLSTYGWGNPPYGYADFAKGSLYLNAKDGKIFKMIGDELVSNWAEIGSAGVAGGISIDQFTQLTDTPVSYIGEANKGVRVKADESGLEFYDLPVESEESFTTELKDKLDAIEANAQVNDTPIENPCELEVKFVQDVDGSTEPKPVSIISGNSIREVVNNIVDNGEYKSLYNDYSYATTFNSGSNNVLTGVSVKFELVDNPDGELNVGIYEVNAGVLSTQLVAGTVQVITLENGENSINFTPFTIQEDTDYALVIGVNLNTKGTIKWLETAGGISSQVNINDEWLDINSNLTHTIFGYKEVPNTGGVGLANEDDCFLGFAIEDSLTGETKKIKTCGKVCGFSGLIPYTTYYLSSTGGLTTDIYETRVMLGVAVSDTCLLIKQSCGKVTPPQEFHILTESGDTIGTESGGTILDHSNTTQGDVV